MVIRQSTGTPESAARSSRIWLLTLAPLLVHAKIENKRELSRSIPRHARFSRAGLWRRARILPAWPSDVEHRRLFFRLQQQGHDHDRRRHWQGRGGVPVGDGMDAHQRRRMQVQPSRLSHCDYFRWIRNGCPPGPFTRFGLCLQRPTNFSGVLTLAFDAPACSRVK
jgi:hypothetical protein